jgi:hypothetical protein
MDVGGSKRMPEVRKQPVAVNEYKDVINTVAKYVEAIRIGSVDMLADAFHKDAVTYGFVDGSLMGGSTNPTVDFIRKNGKSPGMDSHIDVLDITPTTAVVRIVTGNDASGAGCNEYLTLIKLDNGWTVIAKVFHQFDK